MATKSRTKPTKQKTLNGVSQNGNISELGKTLALESVADVLGHVLIGLDRVYIIQCPRAWAAVITPALTNIGFDWARLEPWKGETMPRAETVAIVMPGFFDSSFPTRRIAISKIEQTLKSLLEQCGAQSLRVELSHGWKKAVSKSWKALGWTKKKKRGEVA